MDILYEVCAVGVVITGLLAGAFFSTNHRDLALWSTCAAIVVAVIGGFAYWQDGLWEGDAAAASSINAASNEIVVLKVPQIEADFSRGKKARITWTTKNVSQIPIAYRGLTASVKFDVTEESEHAKEISRLERVAPFQGPKMTIPAGEESGHTMNPAELTEDAYNEVVAGKKMLWTYCAAAYTDSVGRSRVSSTCYKYDSELENFTRYGQDLERLGARIDWDEDAIQARPSLNFESGRMIDFAPKKAIKFVLTFKNPGGTEARVFRGGLKFDFVKAADDVEGKIANLVNSLPPLVGSDFLTRVGPLGSYEIRPADQMDPAKKLVDAVNNGGVVFYIYGRIEFRDISEGFHWTMYCLRYDGKAITPHPIFNATDALALGEFKINVDPTK